MGDVSDVSETVILPNRVRFSPDRCLIRSDGTSDV